MMIWNRSMRVRGDAGFHARKAGRGGIFLPLLLVLAVAACNESPTDDDDDHAEPDGMVLSVDGQTLTYDGDSQTWDGELELELGEETGHATVTFVDHDGDGIHIDDDLYLEVTMADASIAEFEQDTPGEFGGHFHGEALGETEATFMLMHGAVGSGHADFVTTALEVHVH